MADTNPTCLPPRYQRCMIPLSDGLDGSIEWREFDLAGKTFVADGFMVRGDSWPYAIWKDESTLYVNETGGQKGGIWKITRGRPPSEAKLVYRGVSQLVVMHDLQMGAQSGVLIEDGNRQGARLFSLLTRRGRTVPLALPPSARIMGYVKSRWVILLGADWRVGEQLWRQGSIVAIPKSGITSPTPDVEPVIIPTSRQMVDGIQQSASGLYAVIYDNVRARLYRIEHVGGRWTKQYVRLPDYGRMDFVAPDPHAGDVLVEYQSFLIPPAIYAVRDLSVERVSQAQQTFAARPFVVNQLETRSTDGTAVPYFVVRGRNLLHDGSARALLVGYGANAIAMLPEYLGTIGPLWLEEGGVYVVANIRGGGEFGPSWHLAAVKHDKVRAFHDFIAVADDLVRRKITSPRRLAIRGWSSGGLLVANIALRRPDLIGAAVAEIPLLDLMDDDYRFTANTNTEERGSLDDPGDRRFMESISPFEQVSAGTPMPPMLVVPNTTDPVVNPGEARRFAAKMQKLGKSCYFYEVPEGGHSEGVTPDERATFNAVMFSFLDEVLEGPPAR